jgi:hypothetical protein
MLSDENGIPVFVDAHAGGESFVSLDWHFEVDKPPISVLSVVPPPVARREMLYLTYIDAGEVLSRSVPKADPRGPPHLMRRGEIDDE